MSAPKLYLIVREDLAAGAQAVQAAHAMRAFAHEHEHAERSWFQTSNTIALLGAPNEDALHDLLQRADRAGVLASEFREPDLNHSLTAIAVAPQGGHLVRRLPLALQR